MNTTLNDRKLVNEPENYLLFIHKFVPTLKSKLHIKYSNINVLIT